MTKAALRPAMKESPPAGWIPHGVMLIGFVASILACGYFWLIPIEVLEQWAHDRAGNGPFDKFEAVGEADFFVWAWRIAVPLLSILIWRVWLDLNRWLAFVVDVWRGLRAITSSKRHEGSTQSRSFGTRVRTVCCRGLLIAWMVVFAAHTVHGIGLRMHDWPYFRFNSGEVVLPNISDSNRAVIRYLQAATPPESRILLASDQKLFFLSYYLRPRTLFHRMHPGSEHVIPLKDQQRKLMAYRLEELTPDDLAQMPHDYTLEYFEHPDLVDRSQVLNDSAWVAFIRRRGKNPSLIPSYMVRLRSAGERR